MVIAMKTMVSKTPIEKNPAELRSSTRVMMQLSVGPMLFAVNVKGAVKEASVESHNREKMMVMIRELKNTPRMRSRNNIELHGRAKAPNQPVILIMV